MAKKLETWRMRLDQMLNELTLGSVYMGLEHLGSMK